MGNQASYNYDDEVEKLYQIELQRMNETQRPARVSLEEFLESSENFPVKLPLLAKALIAQRKTDSDDEDDMDDFYREPGRFPVENTRMKTHMKVCNSYL